MISNFHKYNDEHVIVRTSLPIRNNLETKIGTSHWNSKSRYVNLKSKLNYYCPKSADTYEVFCKQQSVVVSSEKRNLKNIGLNRNMGGGGGGVLCHINMGHFCDIHDKKVKTCINWKLL